METPITTLIEDIIKAVEAKAEAKCSDVHLVCAYEVGALRSLLDEALRAAPHKHLARLADRFGLEVPKPAPRKALGLRLTR